LQKQKLESKKTIKGIEECTFVPNADKPRDSSSGPGQISDRLYSKNIEARKFEGRTANDVDYERSKSTLTFAPDTKTKWTKQTNEPIRQST